MTTVFSVVYNEKNICEKGGTIRKDYSFQEYHEDRAEFFASYNATKKHRVSFPAFATFVATAAIVATTVLTMQMYVKVSTIAISPSNAVLNVDVVNEDTDSPLDYIIYKYDKSRTKKAYQGDKDYIKWGTIDCEDTALTVHCGIQSHRRQKRPVFRFISFCHRQYRLTASAKQHTCCAGGQFRWGELLQPTELRLIVLSELRQFAVVSELSVITELKTVVLVHSPVVFRGDCNAADISRHGELFRSVIVGKPADRVYCADFV